MPRFERQLRGCNNASVCVCARRCGSECVTLQSGVLPLPPEKEPLWQASRWALESPSEGLRGGGGVGPVGSPGSSITRPADGVLAWPQQEIAEEKWPTQTMRLSGLTSASPVQAGAPPLVRLAAAALRSGLHTPWLLSPAPLVPDPPAQLLVRLRCPRWSRCSSV